MNVIAAILLGIGLFCWWLSGNWYAWAVTFTGLTGFGIFLFPFGSSPWAALLFVIAAWFLTAIPHYIRKRRDRVTVISPS